MPCCEISDCAQMSKTVIAVRHFGLGGRKSLETAVKEIRVSGFRLNVEKQRSLRRCLPPVIDPLKTETYKLDGNTYKRIFYFGYLSFMVSYSDPHKPARIKYCLFNFRSLINLAVFF